WFAKLHTVRSPMSIGHSDIVWQRRGSGTSANATRSCSPNISTAVVCRPKPPPGTRSEEHTSELQSQSNLVCRLLLEKKKNIKIIWTDGAQIEHACRLPQGLGIGSNCERFRSLVLQAYAMTALDIRSKIALTSCTLSP